MALQVQKEDPIRDVLDLVFHLAFSDSPSAERAGITTTVAHPSSLSSLTGEFSRLDARYRQGV